MQRYKTSTPMLLAEKHFNFNVKKIKKEINKINRNKLFI